MPRHRVVAMDFGCKQNILRCLTDAGCDVTVVPAQTTAEDILKMAPDGVFLSNGPGDPAATGDYAAGEIGSLIDAGMPVFGICIGHQLMALAMGATTHKMDRGHRGANHPVKDLATGRIEITSQNHGFVVDPAALPDNLEVTHISLFDGSIEGLRHREKPAFCVQYHPESSPGPHDSRYLFDRFTALMDERKA
jgi:carbamoyl-phosphate synthase small subunit